MSDAALPQKRIFAFAEAAALLPNVRRATEDAVGQVEALRAELERNPRDADQFEQGMSDVVRAWLEGMVARGLEVKGLWLVDFDNGSGYYCWRWPESTLEYFHTYEEGFGGRMRIQ
jgi:hypothetical protein